MLAHLSTLSIIPATRRHGTVPVAIPAPAVQERLSRPMDMTPLVIMSEYVHTVLHVPDDNSPVGLLHFKEKMAYDTGKQLKKQDLCPCVPL